MTKVYGQGQVPGQAGSTAGTGSRARPIPGGWYIARARDTWVALARAAYGDPSLWNELVSANPGKQCRRGEQLFIPKRGAADRMTAGDNRAALRAVDDGTRRGGGQTLEADPELLGDLNLARNQANVGAPMASTRNGRPTMEGGAFAPDDGNHWYKQDEHGADGVGGMGTITTRTARGRLDAVRVDAEKQVQLGDVPVQMRGDVHVGSLQGMARATTGYDARRKELVAEASVRGEAHLVGAQGEIKSGVYGNSVIQGQTTIRGKAYVGAEAGGFASVGIGKSGVMARGGVDAFAGAKVRLDLKQSIGIGGQQVARVGAKAEGWAGVGFKAKAEVGFKDGKLRLGGELGAALGIGGALRFDIEVDVVGTAKAIGKGLKTAGNAVASGFKKVGSFVGGLFGGNKGPDGRVGKGDIETLAKSSSKEVSPELQQAAKMFQNNPAFRNSVDAQRGDKVDGKISREDLKNAPVSYLPKEARAKGPMDKSMAAEVIRQNFDLLDTAKGGKQDGKISQDDLKTLVKENPDCPQVIKDAAQYFIDRPDDFKALGGKHLEMKEIESFKRSPDYDRGAAAKLPRPVDPNDPSAPMTMGKARDILLRSFDQADTAKHDLG